mgnify:CR=1 FL=1
MSFARPRHVVACRLAGVALALLPAAYICDCATPTCDTDDPASSADCDPGRRITVRRLDQDATVTISATITVSMSARKRKTCSAAITVTPPA